MSSGVVSVGERKVMAVVSLFLIFTSLSPIVAFAQPDGTIRVPRDYPTIHEAINAASPGDTILVSSGTYSEGDLLINKTLTLIGEDSETTTIDGRGHVKVLDIQNTSNVVISNFTIQHGGQHGVSLNLSADCIIQNNMFILNIAGIYLRDSAGNKILNNTITWNYHGVFLWQSHDNTISNNKICNAENFGIYLFQSHDNTLLHNELSSCGNGIWTEAQRNLVEGNILSENGGAILSGSEDRIIGNMIRQNRDGLSIRGTDCYAIGNTIVNNNQGILLQEDSSGTLYHNNFVNNTKQLEGNASLYTWDNGCEGNFWSDYNGTDLNGDGVGDTSLPWQGVDYCPLMSPWSALRVFNVYVNETVHPILIHTNSTIASFNYEASRSEVCFNATGPSGSVGFCNVTIPKSLLSGLLAILVDDEQVASIITENATHTSAYFSYAHSTRRVRVFVPILGDVNVDGIVDIYDIVIAASSYGATPSDPNWNPRADIAPRWELIDIFDMVTLASRYGEQTGK
jgi:parallel beta-helix repeat protein